MRRKRTMLLLLTYLIIGCVVIGILYSCGAAPSTLETTGITSDGAILMELVDNQVYKYVDDEYENVCYIHGNAMACLPIK